MDNQSLTSWLSQMWPDWEMDARAISRLERYADILVEWNEKMNLTAITERDDMYVKHFLDSLTLVHCPSFRASGRLIDVGSGGGLPGIPVAVACPSLHVVLCESLKKRVYFLRHVIDELGLDNVEVVDFRAEDMGRDTSWRGTADMVTARAVARLSVLAELCLPLVRQGGTWLAMKGPDVDEEMRQASKAVTLVGGSFSSVDRFHLPGGYGERSIVIVRKESATPDKYPRKAGTPAKDPLEEH